MPRLVQIKGKHVEVNTQAYAASDVDAPTWMGKFAVQVDRGYRKFWAKRGIDSNNLGGFKRTDLHL